MLTYADVCSRMLTYAIGKKIVSGSSSGGRNGLHLGKIPVLRDIFRVRSMLELLHADTLYYCMLTCFTTRFTTRPQERPPPGQTPILREGSRVCLIPYTAAYSSVPLVLSLLALLAQKYEY